MKSAGKIEFGDFQTPHALAAEVCALLARHAEQPDFVIEPTAGKGAFLLAAAKTFPLAALRGWEINRDYVDEARRALAAQSNGNAAAPAQAQIECQDFFTHDWDAQLARLPGRLLVLGNPPWVTNAGVSVVNGANLPRKENITGLKGMAARTGKANFDISEWMLMRLLRALRGREAAIAMLCKTSTARKFLKHAWKNEGGVATASIYRIDTLAHFGAAVDACLLHVKTGANGPEEADVYASLAGGIPTNRIGLAGKDLVSDITSYKRLKHLEGISPFRWRSGVKHDCAAVMELKPIDWENGLVENGRGERVQLEKEYLYPLLKCSDLANGRTSPERVLLLTQKYMGDDTSVIRETAPATWQYLQSHAGQFDGRKSSIYTGSEPFSIFGVGEYAFAPWKVAVSGLHKNMLFQVVGPANGKPVCFDDTCYFIPFERKADASLVCDVLNSPQCRRFMASLMFADSKRPVTVDLLQRLNIEAIADAAGRGTEWRRAQWFTYAPAEPQLEFSMTALAHA